MPGHAADDPLRDQGAHRAVGQQLCREVAEARKRRLDEVHRDGGQREQGVEQPAHHDDEDEQAEHRMGEDAIQAFGEGSRSCGADGRPAL